MTEHNAAIPNWTPVGRDPDPPLFTGPHPQSGFGRPSVVPGTSHVYVTADGDYSASERRPSIGQAFAARRRYDVDISYKTTELSQLELPSAENNFYFPCSISLAWRVHDPVAIVRNGITSPTVVIEQSLARTLRETSAGIRPSDWPEVEGRLNRAFGGPFALPEGITILRFVAKVRIDPHLAEFLHQKAAAQGQVQIDEINRVVVAAALQRGDIGLMEEHLVKHPGATSDVLNLMLSSRNADEAKRQEMFKLLLEHKVIQDVDLERLRENLLILQGGVGTGPLLSPPANGVGRLPPPPVQQPPAIPPPVNVTGLGEWEPIDLGRGSGGDDGDDGDGDRGLR